MVRKSDSDKVIVIGCCVILFEVLKVVDKLVIDGVNIRVIDLFIIKFIDVEIIRSNVKEIGGKIIIVEDYYFEGMNNVLIF